MPDPGRCTGHCCKGFTLDLDALTDPGVDLQDGDYIRAMLVPLGSDPDDGRPHAWRFDCRHFDGRDCTAYEARPAMCRNYPYGKACPRDGCTLAGLGEERGWMWMEDLQEWLLTA